MHPEQDNGIVATRDGCNRRSQGEHLAPFCSVWLAVFKHRYPSVRGFRLNPV